MPRTNEIGAHGGHHGVHGVLKAEEEQVLIVEGVETKDPKDMVVEIKVVEEGVNGVDVVVLIKVCNSDFYFIIYYIIIWQDFSVLVG